MGASTSPSPKLGKSTALNKAQATTTRLSSLVPSLTTQLSPVTVYQPGGTVGGELNTESTTGGIGIPAFTDLGAFYGVWVAPDLTGTGADYYIQVECFGPGGGGGGGSASSGGGGGGGGEYACEDQYPITPGNSYAYVIGFPGTAGVNNSTGPQGAGGTNGGPTIFDVSGLGLAGGVVANGGLGGDKTSVGIGGIGGTGSANSTHFDGGAGGTNSSVNGGDNPVSYTLDPTYFAVATNEIAAWYILNDAATNGGQINDDSGMEATGTLTNYTGGFVKEAITCPTQVPAYTSPSGPPIFPNPTQAAVAPYWKLGSLGAASAKIKTQTFGFAGPNLTVSCWIQCDPSGTWGNLTNTPGVYSVIAANTQNYNSNSMQGYALFLVNNGTKTSPNWVLYATVGNGTIRTVTSYNIGATPGNWYYVVMTYNTGTLNLYVNNSLIQSANSSGYTSVPGGAFQTTIGMDPNSTKNWFFGYISNLWFIEDTALPALIAEVYGATPPTGGCGGGASGGPSAAGGVGGPAAGAAGGNPGTGATQPAGLLNTTTPAMYGFPGGSSGASPPPYTPSGGVFGGGGGGGGNQAASPALTTLTIPFASAATYLGVDAANGGGSIYNVAQQANANSNLNSILVAGGLPSDSATGSKNSLLLLPQGLASELAPVVAEQWLVSQVLLTVTNAYPSNTQESLLEIYWSGDTSLPQTYTGSDWVGRVGAYAIPQGAGTLTFDITEAGLATWTKQGIITGACTAFILGPLNTPTFDAYNCPTGPDYYASIYGPGAVDAFGNSVQPYLTLTLVKVTAPVVGCNGAGGGIMLTYVDDEETPIATIQPYATTDDDGNQFAQGFTGSITAFSPTHVTPGTFQPESWNHQSAATGWAASGNGYNGFYYRLAPDGFCEAVFDLTCGSGSSQILISAGAMPSEYYPNGAGTPPGVNAGFCCPYGVIPSGLANPYIEVLNTGAVYLRNAGTIASGLCVAGYVRWWPGTV